MTLGYSNTCFDAMDNDLEKSLYKNIQKDLKFWQNFQTSKHCFHYNFLYTLNFDMRLQPLETTLPGLQFEAKFDPNPLSDEGIIACWS